MKKCVIFDVDGTVANNDHRVHHVENKPRDWDAYHSLMHLDTVHEPVVALARIIRGTYPLVFCSGRMERYRDLTVEWFKLNEVPFDGFYMRATDDLRDDVIVKRELLGLIRADGWDPVFVVDDRSSVVKMWREEGLVCFQCREGDF